MSVNGLGGISQTHAIKMGRRGAPLKLKSYSIRYVHIQGDEQAHGALIPAKASAVISGRWHYPVRSTRARHAP
jgi:hypothetical protein